MVIAEYYYQFPPQILLVMLYWDTPFGLREATWDSAEPSEDELKLLLASFNAVDRANDSVVVFCCKWESLGKFKQVLLESSWSTYIQPVCWVKTGFNTMIPPNRLLSSVEFYIMGRKTVLNHSPPVHGLSANPLQRHSVIQAPQLRTYYMHSDGSKVNRYEKPGEIIRWFLSRFCLPQGNVVVVGGGAGGDMIGALEGGWSTHVIEQDPVQVEALQRRIQEWEVVARFEARGRQEQMRLSMSGANLPPRATAPDAAPKQTCKNCLQVLSDDHDQAKHICVCGVEFCKECRASVLVDGVEHFFHSKRCKNAPKKTDSEGTTRQEGPVSTSSSSGANVPTAAVTPGDGDDENIDVVN